LLCGSLVAHPGDELLNAQLAHVPLAAVISHFSKSLSPEPCAGPRTGVSSLQAGHRSPQSPWETRPTSPAKQTTCTSFQVRVTALHSLVLAGMPAHLWGHTPSRIPHTIKNCCQNSQCTVIVVSFIMFCPFRARLFWRPPEQGLGLWLQLEHGAVSRVGMGPLRTWAQASHWVRSWGRQG
jgi:hypothetical protein